MLVGLLETETHVEQLAIAAFLDGQILDEQLAKVKSLLYRKINGAD